MTALHIQNNSLSSVSVKSYGSSESSAIVVSMSSLETRERFLYRIPTGQLMYSIHFPHTVCNSKVSNVIPDTSLALCLLNLRTIHFRVHIVLRKLPLFVLLQNLHKK